MTKYKKISYLKSDNLQSLQSKVNYELKIGHQLHGPTFREGEQYIQCIVEEKIQYDEDLKIWDTDHP